MIRRMNRLLNKATIKVLLVDAAVRQTALILAAVALDRAGQEELADAVIRRVEQALELNKTIEKLFVERFAESFSPSFHINVACLRGIPAISRQETTMKEILEGLLNS